MTAGFRLVRRHPWLILLPALADTLLWLGPQLSVRPLADALVEIIRASGMPTDPAQGLMVPPEMLVEMAAGFNLLWLLSNSLTWFNLMVPGLLEPARLGLAATPIDVPLAALPVVAPLLAVAGLGLGSAFLTIVALQLEGPGEQGGSPLRRWLHTWAWMVVYGLILLALFMLSTFALSVGISLLLLLAPALANVFGTLAVLMGSWIFIGLFLMLYFVAAAVVSDGVGLAEAVRRSLVVVTQNFWSTMGLILLTGLILAGFQFIFQRLAQASPIASIVSILANAVLLAGLTAARLIFYRDRLLRIALAKQSTPAA
jgi:hypothetical protein